MPGFKSCIRGVVKFLSVFFEQPKLSRPVNLLPDAYIKFSGLGRNEYYSDEDTDWAADRPFVYAKVEVKTKDYSQFEFLITIPDENEFHHYSFDMKARYIGEEIVMMSLKSGSFISIKFDGTSKSLYPVIIMILDRINTSDSHGGEGKGDGKELQESVLVAPGI
jgi:hypothetical protein